MKNLFFSLFFLMLFSSHAQQSRHLGTWKAMENGTALHITLKKEHVIIFRTGDRVTGETPFKHKGRMVYLTYEIDETRQPPGFSVLMKEQATGKIVSRMTGYIDSKNEKTAEICLRERHDMDPQPKLTEKNCLTFTKSRPD